MSLTSEGMTPADIAAVTGNNRSNNDGWGGNGWEWIIVLFLFAAWGGGGWGGFGGNGGGSGVQGTLTRGDLCMDMNFNDLQNGVRNVSDSVNTGFANLNSTICHQQYDTAMLVNGVTGAVNGGFSALNSTICQQQYDTANMINGVNNTIQNGFNTSNVVALQNQNALQAQLAQCCCENREGQAQINYNMATQACDTRNTIQNSTRDIIDNQNANTRAILDKMCQQEIAAKDAQIAAQNQQIFGLQLAASQEKQNNYIVNALRPFPVASYSVPNPFTGSYGYQSYGCGCNTGCCNG